jgi:hypothetical protein
MSFMPPDPGRGESIRQTDREIDARANAYAASHPQDLDAHKGLVRRLWARLTHRGQAQPKP